MRAALLSIGDELTLGESLDTNSAWLAARLGEIGVVCVEHRTVEDDRDAIAQAVGSLLPHMDVLVLTGGLGPTDDDLTREALADALTPGQALVRDDEALRRLEERFAQRGRPMPQSNLSQAMRPEPMRCLENPHGTAPGLACVVGKCHLFALPGPPGEMKPMFIDHVAPSLNEAAAGSVVLSAQVHEFGLGESEAAERLEGMTSRDRRPLVGTTVSSPGNAIVSARIHAGGLMSEIKPLVDADVQEIERRWWPYAFGRDGVTLASATHVLLRRAEKTVVTAESCTGGLLGKLLVDPGGASGAYLGGWITYSNEMKTASLAVPNELIEAHGAVSVPVAEAMASGAIANARADYALAISGLAGPDGGTEPKPVGTVFIALASQTDDLVTVQSRRFLFPGDREAIRLRSALAALQMLRFALLTVSVETPLLWEAPSWNGPPESPEARFPASAAAPVIGP